MQRFSIVVALFGLIGGGAARAEQVSELDLLIEQMAQHLTFEDSIEATEVKLLKDGGYSVGPRVEGSHAVIMRVFPAARKDRATVVAFRGTVFSDIGSLLDDVQPKGVGLRAFNDNYALIQKTLQQAAGRGRVIIAGFSLGGALAMRAAVKFPTLISRVVTFHPPGIQAAEVAKLRAWNKANPARAITSVHYQIDQDLVSKAGEAFTDGVIHNYRLDGVKVEFLLWHCTYILADEALERGRTLPAHDTGRHVVYLKDEPSSAKVTSAPETLRKIAGVPATAMAKGYDDAKSGTETAVHKTEKAGKTAVHDAEKALDK